MHKLYKDEICVDSFLCDKQGINNLIPEYYNTNVKISLAVQNFILKTKRFS